MSGIALRSNATWAEDRAPVRTDPSTVPQAETEARATSSTSVARSSQLRDWHESDKPSRHDAANCPAGRPSTLAYADGSKFQFTLNQDKILIAEVKGKPTIAHENNGNIAMKFELTVQGDMDKYDQWQKRFVPLLERLATKSGEKFVKASVIQDSYLTTALSNVLVNEYTDDAGKQRILSDPAFLRSCAAFRRFEAPGVGLGIFNDGGQDRVTFVVNTGRNKLQDRTTWRWFSLPLTCPERRIRVEVIFLDKSGGQVVKDVLQFEGRGCTCPGRLLMYKWSGGICEIDGAVLSPYWLVFTSAYPQSVSYAPSLTLTRSIDITRVNWNRLRRHVAWSSRYSPNANRLVALSVAGFGQPRAGQFARLRLPWTSQLTGQVFGCLYERSRRFVVSHC